MRITVPTWLTFLRIALLPVMVVVFYSHAMVHGIPLRYANFGAAIVFVLASVTDWLDGFLARRWHQTSPFGAFLDPVADKLMVAVTLFLLVQTHPTVLLAVVSAVIVGREIAVSALREWMATIGQHRLVRVAMMGKVKTVVQMVAIVVLLVERSPDVPVLRYWNVGEVLLLIAAILTIYSGLAYLRAARPAFDARDDDK